MAHGKDSGSSYENSTNRVAPNRHAKGEKKYKEVISRDNNGQGSNLPFTFIKPPSRWQPKRDIFHVCDFCFSTKLVNKNTVGTVCGGCKKFSKVHSDNSFADEESLNIYLDLLNQ